MRIKTDASQFELKEEGHSVVQQNSPAQLEECKVVGQQVSPVLQEEEGLKDHMTSTAAEEIAVEPVEGGRG